MSSLSSQYHRLSHFILLFLFLTTLTGPDNCMGAAFLVLSLDIVCIKKPTGVGVIINNLLQRLVATKLMTGPN